MDKELRRRQKEVEALDLSLFAHAAEVEEANNQLRAFTHCLSQELRQPLATIQEFSELLAGACAKRLGPQGRRYAAMIRAETGRMARILGDMSYLATIQRTELRWRRVDLSLLAMEAFADLKSRGPQRRVEFECPSELVVPCDEQLMRIAVSNLIGNAWKFSSKCADARISLSAEQDAEKVVVCVRDNGAGFDMKQVGRLFAPFQRLHAEDEFPGSGVGLVAVKRVISLHGGDVWAESKPGAGAAFFLCLSARR
jgi:signal transduction histidine kinase